MENIYLLNKDDIIPGKYQPRTHFNDTELVELSKSIKKNGLIQPIVVRDQGQYYEIIAGERRFRACCMAGFEEIPCVIIKADDYQSANMALVENIQRTNLSPIEEAFAYQKILDESQITQAELAKQVGKSQASIANKLRLLNLPNDIQQLVNEKQLTERHARALLMVSVNELDDVVKYIVDHQLTVAQTEDYIKSKKGIKKTIKNQTNGFSKNINIGINTIKQAKLMCDKVGLNTNLSINENKNEVIVTVKFLKEN